MKYSMKIFYIPEIKPGEYELEIEAFDEKTLARSIVRKILVKK